MSKRGQRWNKFALHVLNHIDNYTVKQYGDYPDDQLAGFDVDEFAMNMKRYINRVKSNQRGYEDSLLDCLKLAHYACELWYKKGGDNGKQSSIS